MSYSYRSIMNPVEGVTFKEKGSKFIGYAYPVEDEEDVKSRLMELWEKYPDATHICYAYRLGVDGEKYRANDDGEPSGTAGLPIYNQIVSKDVTHVLVASVRFYGGTKLGVSGLIKAYKLSAQMVLEEVEIVEKYLTQKIDLEFSYEDQGAVMRNIDKFNAVVISTNFTEKCQVRIRIRKDMEESFLASFEALHRVKISLSD